jgi:hypothetical protein
VMCTRTRSPSATFNVPPNQETHLRSVVCRFELSIPRRRVTVGDYLRRPMLAETTSLTKSSHTMINSDSPRCVA